MNDLRESGGVLPVRAFVPVVPGARAPGCYSTGPDGGVWRRMAPVTNDGARSHRAGGVAPLPASFPASRRSRPGGGSKRE